jgi:hypothetical protein
VLDTLRRCQVPSGGFGGGPGQLAHLAPTYAAVNALAILGRAEGYALVDRPALLVWLQSLRTRDGLFCMHADGEVDVRGAYCAASVARLLRLPLTPLFDGTAAGIARCGSCWFCCFFAIFSHWTVGGFRVAPQLPVVRWRHRGRAGRRGPRRLRLLRTSCAHGA